MPNIATTEVVKIGKKVQRNQIGGREEEQETATVFVGNRFVCLVFFFFKQTVIGFLFVLGMFKSIGRGKIKREGRWSAKKWSGNKENNVKGLVNPVHNAYSKVTSIISSTEKAAFTFFVFLDASSHLY